MSTRTSGLSSTGTSGLANTRTIGPVTTRTSGLARGAVGVAFVVACCSAYPVSAQDAVEKAPPSKQQNIGVVTGLAIGAVAAGPVGAAAGAAAGGWLGERFHRQASARAALQADLDHAAAERAKLAANVTELNGSLAQEQARGKQLDLALSHAHQFTTVVGFRTNDDTVQESAIVPLQKLGAMAVALPDATLRIAGYADPRGSEAVNLALSQRRAEAVAGILAEAGVPQDRLIVEARGKTDSTSDAGDLDGYAFDRRVSVTVERAQPEAIARNP